MPYFLIEVLQFFGLSIVVGEVNIFMEEVQTDTGTPGIYRQHME